MVAKGLCPVPLTLVIVSLIISLALAVWSFIGIVKGYRRRSGLPWVASIVFAAAAIATIFALNALLLR
ncbi:MAG: hypothetical protein ACXW2H_08735 [Candidatus Aminicenantales bacterium]